MLCLEYKVDKEVTSLWIKTVEAYDPDVDGMIGMDQIEEALTEYGQSPRTYSLIHADLHPNNILIDTAGLHLIDFDDAGYGWHQYEIACALYRYEDSVHYGALRDALLSGYRAIRPFAHRDAELLPLFLLLRRLLMLSWAWDRPELGLRDSLPDLIDVACSRVEAFEFDVVMKRIRE